MATKKIQFELDVDGKPIDVIIDKTLNLKQQFRELTKEINKTQEGTKEFELLSTKLGDVSDKMQTTKAKSKDLFGSLSLLPGPVGMFSNSVDSAIGSLKLFSSFSMKDLKFQLGETLDDFKDIASNISKATGITKIYTVLNGALANSFKAVGIAEGVAATGAKALAGALTATGVGALVVAIGYLVGKMMEWASSTEEADMANERLNTTLKAQNDLIAKNAKDIENFAKQDVLRAKIAGKTEKEIYDIQVQANKDLLANRRKANDDAYAELQKFEKKQGDYGKLTDEQRKEKQKELVENEKKTYDAITDQITANGTFELEYQNTQAEKLRDKKKAIDDKKREANKQHLEKIKQDTKTAGEMLLDLQQENASLALKDERTRQDQELKNQKEDEERKIKALELSDTVINGKKVTAEQLRNNLLTQVKTKYQAKQTDLDTKRNEDDLKAKEDFNKRVSEIRIGAIKNDTERTIAERNQKYVTDLAELEKDKEFIKKSETEKAEIRKNLKTTANNDVEKITIDAQLRQKALEKGDNDSRYARIAEGVKNDLDLQRTLLEEKKVADEKYYAEQLAREGLTADQIRELNDRKLNDQILYTQKSNEIEANRVAVKQKALDDIISIAGAESDVGKAALIAKQILAAKELVLEVSKTITFSTQAAARSTVAVAEGTAQTAKIGFPQNIPMLIGYAAQAVGIISAITSAVKAAKSSASQSSSQTSSPGGVVGERQTYGDGGLINGPSHQSAAGGTLINAEGGESIINKRSTAMFMPLLSALNQAGGGTSFSSNAINGASYDKPNSEDTFQPIIKTYVVSSEMTSSQERNAKLKDLSTL